MISALNKRRSRAAFGLLIMILYSLGHPLGVMMQACGLNEVGLHTLSKLGESISVRSLLDLRTSLAVQDEADIKEAAKDLYFATVLDNLDRHVKKVLQHKTLPILLGRKFPDNIDQLDKQRKSLEEVMSSFTPEFFSLDSSSNSEEKEAFLQVL